MKLNFNELTLKHVVDSRPPDKEGRLLYRSDTSSRGKYREYWFRLINNLLFYSKTNQFGNAASSAPVGVLVLVDYTTKYEEEYVDQPFVFSITFLSARNEPSKHYFSGISKEHCVAWVNCVRNADIKLLRARMAELTKRLTPARSSRRQLISGVNKSAEDKKESSVLVIPGTSSLFYVSSAPVVDSTKSASKNNESVQVGTSSLFYVSSNPVVDSRPLSEQSKTKSNTLPCSLNHFSGVNDIPVQQRKANTLMFKNGKAKETTSQSNLFLD